MQAPDMAQFHLLDVYNGLQREIPLSRATEDIALSKRLQKLPPGWDDARIREVIAHYEDQTEDEQFAEIESAQEAQSVTRCPSPQSSSRKSRLFSRGVRVPHNST